MKIKKIVAGFLAFAAVMSISVPAFAVAAPDKTKYITRPSEKEYEAYVEQLRVELDVEFPAQMRAYLNPYGAEVAVSDDKYVTTKMKSGVLSWAYEILNYTRDYGIFIDACDVRGTASKGIEFTDSVPASQGEKQVYMALVFAKDADTFSRLTGASAKTGTDENQKTAYIPISETPSSQQKFGYIKGAVTGCSRGVIGFVGNTSKQGSTDNPSAPTKTTEWTDDDSITVDCILKIGPAPVSAAAGDFA